jgi:hypothetical protein
MAFNLDEKVNEAIERQNQEAFARAAVIKYDMREGLRQILRQDTYDALQLDLDSFPGKALFHCQGYQFALIGSQSKMGLIFTIESRDIQAETVRLLVPFDQSIVEYVARVIRSKSS